MLYLTEQDVTELFMMPEALNSVEAAFKAQASGEATNESRRRVRASGATLHVMSGAIANLDGRSYLGLKSYSVAAGKARFYVQLFDAGTGELLALIEADKLGQMRTGAASGIATKYLARTDAETVGVYGSGWQAQSQLQAVCAVRQIKSIRVYSRTPEKREKFCETMRVRLKLDDIQAATKPQEVTDADILITITSSREPVLQGAWIRPGVHVNAAGGNSILRREFDDEVIKRASLITVDSLDQSRLESGEFVSAVEKGLLTWERVRELRFVVSGELKGREANEQITLFKSLGLAIEDIAAAAFIYRKAVKQGVGKQI
ncbi:MAG TPA: ornithine cyclodeaminase family protein [Blastocatellia bacterium]|nr:ornithine cyclodeaminase family protein [Blastocatellia bacterium]